MSENGKTNRNGPAWAATGGVILVMAVLCARTIFYSHLNSGDGGGVAAMVMVGGFCLLTLVGLSIGWWRLYQRRAEHRNRPKPLDLG